MNLTGTVKGAELQRHVKWQIPRIEDHKDKGDRAGAQVSIESGHKRPRISKQGYTVRSWLSGHFLKKCLYNSAESVVRDTAGPGGLKKKREV